MLKEHYVLQWVPFTYIIVVAFIVFKCLRRRRLDVVETLGGLIEWTLLPMSIVA